MLVLTEDIGTSAAKDMITFFIEKGYVKNGKKFNPTKNMTRAEFIKILSQVV